MYSSAPARGPRSAEALAAQVGGLLADVHAAAAGGAGRPPGALEIGKWRLRSLEIGAGAGLPSLVAARAGYEVVATDFNPEVRAVGPGIPPVGVMRP